ncbi:MAG TPA: hypothetical protein VF705_06020, partial [Longimicrobium sp.]
MRHLDRSTAALSLALLLAPCTIAAQDAVPGELVRALFASGRSERAPDIVVGRVPDGFPAALVPAGARVVGGIRRDSLAMTLVVAVPLAPDAASAAHRQALAGAGWAAPQEMREARGFVSSGATEFRFLCRGNEMVTTSAFAAPGGGAYLRLNYSVEGAQSPCASMRMSRGGRSAWDDMPIPRL